MCSCPRRWWGWGRRGLALEPVHFLDFSEGQGGAGPSSAKGPRSRVGLEATESEGWEASSTSSKVRRVWGFDELRVAGD